MGDRTRKREDLSLDEAWVLPAREALSLISTAPFSAYGAGALADAAHQLPDTDAEASGGGEHSVASDDRTVEIARTDTASTT
jgi:hypothetical protein